MGHEDFINGRQKAEVEITGKVKNFNAVGILLGQAQPGADKWDRMSKQERVAIIRKAVPSGSWDFYADSTFRNLFGGVQSRLEKYLL